MSHDHDDHSHSHGHSQESGPEPCHGHGGHDPHDLHGHGDPGAVCTGEDDANASGNTQRYEMQDLFRDEAPENQHFFKVVGLVLLVVLLALALLYPFFVN